MKLSCCAGWNQTEYDWSRLLELQPDGCLGIEVETGNIVATATVVLYGADLAWIGMVLTLPEYRGRGLARKLMHAALEICSGITTRLDASDMGKPLYEQLGFLSECSIERWRRDPGLMDPASATNKLFIDAALDRAVFGADRSPLLEALSSCEAASVGRSYAFGRPGSLGPYFGPCVSNSPLEAEHLLRWFVRRHADQPVFLDLFPHHEQSAHIARNLGFRPVRRLTRMVRVPARPVLPDPRCYAIAGFEWG